MTPTTTDPTPPEFDVFISHASADDLAVTRLASALTKGRLSVWVDHQQIKLGSDWNGSIQHALIACPCVIFALTKASAKSKECAAEYRYAMSNGKSFLSFISKPPIPVNFPGG
ncbi:MAG TPA: toll/interleukin-1 receptor domain-containing protein [Phototrophicaceae bacterium]|jgi:hypothetical protein|nr:toll/interleukin-1 receptor domain-containing protein [Phototrophicaceae bacterium]